MNQNTSSIIMIRPKHFDFNKETASNNYFQKEDKSYLIIDFNNIVRQADEY